MRPITVTQNPINNNASLLYTGSPGSGAITLLTNTVDVNVGGRIIGFASGGNDSGITFTITGLDQNGLAATEAVTGASGATAVTTKFYSSVTSVTHTGSVASTLTIGTVNSTLVSSSAMIPINFYSRIAAQVVIEVTGTINYTVKETFDPILSGNPTTSAAILFSPSAFSGKTSNVNSQIDVGATGVVIIINSYSNGATLTARIIQPSNSNLG